VVKAFNHIYAAELTTHGQPAGSPERGALAIAGNDARAKKDVVALLDQFGFDTVDLKPLGESWRIQRDTPGYGPAYGGGAAQGSGGGQAAAEVTLRPPTTL